MASYYYSFFFGGLILGSFIWPLFIGKTTKRNLLLIGLLVQMITVSVQGFVMNFKFLFLCRFIFGLFLNMDTIGKDFIFEIVPQKYRQYAFNIRTIFGLFGYYAGSFIGYEIYHRSNKSFALSSFFIGKLFYLGVVFFFINFFCFFKTGEIEDKQSLYLNMRRTNSNQGKSKSLWTIFVKYFSDVQYRGIILTNVIAIGTFKTIQLITTFYVEQNWTQNGLGLSSEILS